MTESEAIKEVRFNMSTIGLNNEAAKIVVEARDMAINALEKQIPKKPIIIFEQTHDCVTEFEYECPICGNIYIELAPCHEWCSNCGNKFDWSDEE